jgi:hypothetical protein
MSALRPDLVFSYWIYVWYVLYVFKLIQYSPKLALIIGVIDNIFMFIMMLLYGTSKKTIFYFIIVNTLIKVVPLYYLKNEQIKVTDIYFTCGLFLLFIIWLHINKQSLVGNIKIIYDSLLYGKNETPFMALLQKIEKNYKHLEIF